GGMAGMGDNHDPAMKAYVGIWIGLLCIAGIEVFLTYRGFSTHALLAVLLILAFFEAAIGLLYFMHLKYERRNLLWTLMVGIIFVLLMMNQIWPDAYRMISIGLR
ncbi:MAG: cytochrome C oxidase subunit IV family protein, partial [Candidatus Acidiferrales bacterium]